MIVRVLARRNRHRNVVLAHQVIGHADVVEVVHLEHDVVEAAIGAWDSEGNGVVAVVAIHKDQPDGSFAAAKFVLDAAAHPEMLIKASSRVDVALANDAVTEASGASLESPMHRAARMERLVELNQRPVKNLDWISVGVVELEDFGHATLVAFLDRADPEFNSRLGWRPLILRE